MLLSILCYTKYLFSDDRNIQDNYEFTYTILNSTGGFVGSQTVTLKIKKSSNEKWLDFNDNTFKLNNITNLTTNLSENTTGQYYYYVFNPPTTETMAEDYKFIIDNVDDDYGDHQVLTVLYSSAIPSIDNVLKAIRRLN
jgi:hypothetical protein